MIGYSIGPFPDTLIEKIEKNSEEFDFIEIPIGEGEIPPKEIDGEKLSNTLKKNDLDLIVHLPFRQPIMTDIETFNNSVIDYFENLLEFSEQIGAKKAVVHTDCRKKFEIEDNMEKLEKQLIEISKIGEKYDVEICFENVNIGYFNAPQLFELAEILDDNNLSMCFDTGHALYETDQETIEEFIEEYSHIISHFHVQDTRENKDLHMPIGSGEIDFNFLTDTEEATYCLEIFTDDEEYIKISRQRVQKLISN